MFQDLDYTVTNKVVSEFFAQVDEKRASVVALGESPIGAFITSVLACAGVSVFMDVKGPDAVGDFLHSAEKSGYAWSKYSEPWRYKDNPDKGSVAFFNQDKENGLPGYLSVTFSEGAFEELQRAYYESFHMEEISY